ncbi:hypothetical protein BC834DRAFT_967250 [Gloeopeniophorella convolvens]|nr:hypothetical protein BC834DRAFT_967250 [Gloeopeniophorella convolvens]
MDSQGTYDVALSSIAALSFLVWDILITLDQEVGAIWPKPNRFYAKWLFLFIRYFAVAMQIPLLFIGTYLPVDFHYTEADCVRWYIFQQVGTQLLVAAVEVILIMRVHALYDRKRSVMMALGALFLAENAAMVVSLVRVVPSTRFDPTCILVHTPPGIVTFAIAFFAFETVLFLLTFIKFYIALRAGWGRTPVTYLLVRDSTWAFALIFVTLCVNAGFYLGAGDSNIAGVAFQWLLSIEAFAGGRIVLNLHALSLNSSSDSLQGIGHTTSTSLVFTAPYPASSRTQVTPRGTEGRVYSNQRGRSVSRSRVGAKARTEHEGYELACTRSGGSAWPRTHENAPPPMHHTDMIAHTNNYSGDDSNDVV